MTSFHSASAISCGGLRMLIPALLNRMSTRPNALRTSSAARSMCSGWVTSAWTGMVSTSKSARIPAAAASDFAVFRPSTAILAPASASPRAMPRPIPPLPPVTIATLPLRSNTSAPSPSPCKRYRQPGAFEVIPTAGVNSAADAAHICESRTRGMTAATRSPSVVDDRHRRRRVPQMLARVPFIPGLDIERDAAHRRVWAIVLTGDEPPVAGRAPRVRRASSSASRWPVTDAVARPRALERASRLVPPGHMITVTTRRWARAWDVELEGVPGARRLVQPSYRGRAVEMLLPLLKIARHDPSATVIVLPADHGIDHEARFLRYASRAVWAVALRPDLPILIGAHPHAPVHGGWIEPGAPVEGLEE